jgi:mannose-6-phosphate isomerase-like protein (cupin superfamily)
MTIHTGTIPRVLGPKDGEITGDAGGRTDRYLLNGSGSEGRLSVVEHTLPPGVLAGPMHLHSREDEYSFVIEGQLGAIFGDEEVLATAGDFVFKPRGEWHTFWNPGKTVTRILEIITPSGLEDLFRKLGEPGTDMTPEALPALAAEYGCQVDFERTMEIVARHGLTF